LKIVIVLDSLEMNGGSSMFLEMVGGFRKYYPNHEIVPLVISKTGLHGRKELTNRDHSVSYGCGRIPSMSYEMFSEQQEDILRGASVVIHHRLECTRAVKFPIPYIVINHTVQKYERIAQFKNANRIISVCKYLKKITRKHAHSKVILNGVENDYIKDVEPAALPGRFKTGRCHRLYGLKFIDDSVPFLNKLRIKGHRHYVLGPRRPTTKGIVQFVGPVFDRNKKMSFIKNFDVYFYDTQIKEGCSMAILESMAAGIPVVCRPLGGNKELVLDGVNGFYYDKYKEAGKILVELGTNKKKLDNLKQATADDFMKRLHVSHMLNKYIDLIKKILWDRLNA